jgi:hypothetical protein
LVERFPNAPAIYPINIALTRLPNKLMSAEP